jgi:hypothetical protein
MTAFLLTWNPRYRGWDDYENDVGSRPFVGAWSVSQGQQIGVGDRVYLLRQSVEPRGIVASGRVTKAVFTRRHWDPMKQGELAKYVLVRWDTLLPLDQTFSRQDLKADLPKGHWDPASSGEKVRESVESALEKRWRAHVRTVTGAAIVDVPVVVTGPDGEPVWVPIQGGHTRRMRKARKGQRSFRKALLKMYGATCAFSGSAPEEALQAAHLYAYSDEGQHHERGGLLLRADLHRLFDEGLIRVDVKDKIVIDQALRKWNGYWALNGRPLKVGLIDPQREWLAAHREAFGG